MAFSKTLAFLTCFMAIRAALPASAVDCSTIILSLADCLLFVANDSELDKPSGVCCTGLKMVLNTSPECLCVGFGSSGQLGTKLNLTKALELPFACHVSAPSISNCGPAFAPEATPRPAAPAPQSTSPARAPEPASSTPAPEASVPSPSTPSDSGTANALASPPEKSGSAPISISFITTAIGLLLASISSS